MPSPLDPYATLGLSPGATLDEIRRAYRRLAKANHPDSAGETSLPRFLAIQAAYELLAGPNPTGFRTAGARPTPKRSAPRDPWRTDPSRGRSQRSSRPGPAPGAADGATGRRRRAPGEGPAAGGPRRPPSGAGDPGKATLGSTSYDAAADEPFEPEWSGGTWYGASSGTYWTLNPKEYADPRKHGPEYQRRARRRAGAGPASDPTVNPDAAPDATPEAAPEPEPMPAGAGFDDAWNEMNARFDAESQPSGRGRTPPPPADPPRDGAERDASGDEGPADRAAAAVAAASGLLGFRGRFSTRVGLALVGWPPIGVALSTIAGEVTGCGRFAAGCVDLFGVGTWLAQLAIIAILLALPSVAALSAVGTLAALAASVPTAVILSASGGARDPGTSAGILGGVLAVAYVAGVVFAVVRRWRPGRVP